jgi:predicted flap endonuclease-1-like 5' DNA nuclease
VTRVHFFDKNRRKTRHGLRKTVRGSKICTEFGDYTSTTQSTLLFKDILAWLEEDIMEWLFFFIGAVVGWVAEWLVDFFFWRRKYTSVAQAEAQVRDELAAAQEELEVLRAQLTVQEGRISPAAQAAAVAAAADRSTEVMAGAVDDLTMIEGIGPRTVELLNEHDIYTFAQLADTDVEDLRAILQEGGSGFRMADPTSWPRQARLAANRDWVRLTALKQQLVGGVRRPAQVEVPDDDLTMIEGVGPKTVELLNQHGIRTFTQLGDTDVAELHAILQQGGSGFHMADPTSWPRQARLAANRDWVRLAALKQELVGGVRRPSTEEDNLTMIEGIGPQVSALLKENGIRTFAQLAKTDPDRLRDILNEAGPQFRLSVPDTWPEQAELAAANSWEQLQELQSRLAAGRAES